jgi:predicted chitinase
MPLKTENIEIKITKNYTKEQIEAGEPGKYAQDLRKQYLDKGYDKVRVPYKRRTQTSGNFSNIDNPIKDAPAKTAFALKTQPNPQYYLKFGYLLEYVKDKILLKIKVSDNHDDNPPIFDIDNDIWSNHMYSLPNQISLDPRICLVRNSNFDSGKSNKATEVFPSLSPFREADIEGNKNQNAAYPMNIYLNFNFIIECLKTDERGDVSIFDFLKSICDGLNKALGGINNLEPVIDEDTNTLKIIDTTPIPGYSNPLSTKKYTLQLYGYNKKGSVYSSNFIRKVDLKTAITPEFATMITIGATAGGYVKGVEATAFSKWNWGITDRFKTEFTPGDPVSVTPPDSLDEAEINYATEFLAKGYDTRYGFTSLNPSYLKLSSDLIEKNISIGTEFFKYIVAKNKSTSGGTIGFIPFKISFTMDGLSGIKIYNKLNVDTRFLPKAYGDNLDLIVTGVSHKLANNDWETDIEATVIPKTKSGGAIVITSQDIKEVIQEVREAPKSPSNKPQKDPPKDLIKAMKEYGITSPLEKAHFLAQTSHESGRFQYKEEIASGKAYEGTKDLGNTQPGDGVRFKGRGYIQVTGRANYTKYNQYLKSKDITDDVIKNPSLVTTKYAADISAWYWSVLGPEGVKNFPKKSKEGDSLKIINKIGTWINGGNPPNGAQDRIAKFNYYWGILKNNPNAFS